MGRRKIEPSFLLFRALVTCVGTPMESAARDYLARFVVAEGEIAHRPGALTRAVAAKMGVSERSARRLLVAYGWAFTRAATKRAA